MPYDPQQQYSSGGNHPRGPPGHMLPSNMHETRRPVHIASVERSHFPRPQSEHQMLLRPSRATWVQNQPQEEQQQQQQQHHEEEAHMEFRNRLTPPQPQDPAPSQHPAHPHPSRCPPLNLEFLWKLYHQRNHPDAVNSNRRNQPTQARIDTLKSQGFPTGLASLLLHHAIDHPVRVWLVDNCGTMHRNDGHLVSQSSSGKVTIVNCTRWEEVTSTLNWHAELAAWCQTPMAIRLLQDPGIHVGPQQVGISASKHYSSTEEVKRLKSLLKKTRPTGATSPVPWHLRDLFPSVQSLVPILQQTQTKLVVCICTDSIPTDANGQETPEVIQEFLATLLQLSDWPVQVVLRLSTDEERVVQFYQTQTQMNPNMSCQLQVLDDYVSECQQIQRYNPWLHYGYPMHLCREEGIHLSSLEALSQRPVLATELCDVVSLIFGVVFDTTAYNPETQYPAFRQQVASLNKQTGVLWNPTKQKFVMWMDLKKLDKLYQPKKKSSLRSLFGKKKH